MNPSISGPPVADRPHPVPQRRLRAKGEWIVTLAAAFVLALGLRAYAVEQYVIPSESMVPTLQVDDRILVEKPLLDPGGVGQGDVVVFHRPAAATADTPETLVKRVVALGGQAVSARDGVLFVDGQSLSEPYAAGPTQSFGPVVVPADQLFVMGDNRAASYDSRRFGPIPASSVIGSAVIRSWPLDRIGGL